MRLTALLSIVTVFLSTPASGRLLIYSDDVFLGCLDCVSTAPDSVCNFEGHYGSLKASKSIWNQSGDYGNPESPKSPWSGSTQGPIIMDENSTVFGWFQINPEGGYTQSAKLADLFHSMGGDLKKIRQLFCQD